MDSGRRENAPSLGEIVGGAIPLAISSIVLIGWLTDAPVLIRFHSQWDPIQPNTALSLVLVSLGWLLALRGGERSAVILGIAAATLAALTAAQGPFEIDLGIDRILIGPRGAPSNLEPGRMAPNSALGLLLAGAALVMTIARLHIAAAVCGVGAWAVGVGALLGYATGVVGAYEWGSRAPMARLTAASLVLLSTGVLLRGLRAARRENVGAWQGPLVAGLGSAAIALLFYQALVARQEAQIATTIDATAQRIRTEIRAAIQTQRGALAGVAREWNDTFFKRRGAWESDVRIAIARSPGMSSVAWFEPTGELTWKYPPNGEIPQITLPSANAKPDVSRSWTRATVLSDGARGFVLLAPVLDSGSLDAWMYGVFRSDEFFGELSQVLPEGFVFQVASNRALIYDGGYSEGVPRRWIRRLALERGSDVAVSLHPTPEWLASQRSNLPQVILAAGFVFSGLMVIALRAAQTAANHAVALEGEVRAHQQAEDEIRRLNRELEERVSQRTAELQRTNEELRGFASFLSHELRQPVSAQALCADILATEYASSLDETGRRYLAQLRRNVKRTSDLIGAQLALAEISSSPIQIGSIDLAAVLDELRCDLKSNLDEVDAIIEGSDLPRVFGDPRLLYPLFRNLIENSIKYRRRGVPLEIRVSGSRDDDMTEIVYADNGQGFPPEDAERIFGAHQRIDGSGSTGLGLGLAVCRRIMDRIGGSIVAQGDPGCGASFRIRFLSKGRESRDTVIG